MKDHSSSGKDPKVELSEAIQEINVLHLLESDVLNPLVIETLFASNVKGGKSPQEDALRNEIAEMLGKRQEQHVIFADVIKDLEKGSEENAAELAERVRAFSDLTRRHIIALGQIASDLVPLEREDIRLNLDNMLSNAQKIVRGVPSCASCPKGGCGPSHAAVEAEIVALAQDSLTLDTLETERLNPVVARILLDSKISAPFSERQTMLRADIQELAEWRSVERRQFVFRTWNLRANNESEAQVLVSEFRTENDNLRKYIIAVAQLAYDLAPPTDKTVRAELERIADIALKPAESSGSRRRFGTSPSNG